MSIIKYKASADASITNAFYSFSNQRAYLSNTGAADSLQIFSIFHSGSESEKSRILINFPIENLVNDRNNGVIPASGSVKFLLSLYNVQHTEMTPQNYYVSVVPISSSWQEGYGLDLDNRLDNGQSGSNGYGVNWLYKSLETSPYTWTTQGGDFILSYETSSYFETGLENLQIDVTRMVEDQISNIIPRNGFCIKLSGSYESGALNTSFFTKKFSSRSSEYFYKVPTLQAAWESVVKDDRNNFFFKSDNLSNTDNTQNIYFYNRVNGKLKNIYNNPQLYLRVKDSNNIDMITAVTASNPLPGVYKASVILTGSADEEVYDLWYSGSYTYYSGSIDAKIRTFDDTYIQNDFIFTLNNLKKSYKSYEKPAIRIFAREKNWSPNIYTVANNSINTLTFNNLYYKVSRVIDDFVVIDYGINPIAYTKCSYDKNGNYFDLDMQIFEPGYMYKIDLMLLEEEIKKEVISSFYFKVE